MGKFDLALPKPLMNAAGMLGFAPDLRHAVNREELGAFVTNPISLERRTPASGVRFISYPGGFLLHTGYPNPGLRRVIKEYAARWGRAPLGIIVHLLVQEVADAAEMSQRLESIENVIALELGFDWDADISGVRAMVTAAARVELPVIARLPLERAALLAPAAIEAGAAAVSLAPPRGMLPGPGNSPVRGRLYGPGVFPLALAAAQAVINLGLPVIAAGGVYSPEQVAALLDSGALAVQLDSVLWQNHGTMLSESVTESKRT